MLECKRAFTLTELLLVIGIIALLMVLAIPVVKGVRERGNAARCVSNLKQTGLALLAFANDRNGNLIPRNYATAPIPQERYWSSSLLYHGYIINPDVLYCPGFFPYHNRTPGIYDIYNNIGQCYGMRDWRTYNGSAAEFTLPKRLLAIRDPGEFFLIGDSYWKVTAAQGYSIVPGAADGNSHIHLRHGGETAHLFFADGSVRAVDRTFVQKINQTQAPYGRGTGFAVWPQ